MQTLRKHYSNGTFAHKALYASIMLFLAVLVIGGAFSVRDNPLFQGKALSSWLKHYLYAAEFGILPGEFQAGIYSNAGASSAGSVPILLYHGVMERNVDPENINMTQNEFKEQMFALKRAGYQTVGMKELEDFLTGKANLPPKSFVLTFDDGRKDSFYGADPVLAALGYKAVMFAISGKSIGEESLESTYYLTERELKRMLDTGRWEIESHGKEAHTVIPIGANGEQGYFYGNKLWLAGENRIETDQEFQDRVRDDLTSSEKEIEETLGINVRGLAFPFGEFGEESRNFPEAKSILPELARAIYSMSFYQFRTDYRYTQNYPANSTATSAKNFFLKRIEAKSGDDPVALVKKVERGSAKSLPFKDAFVGDQGWFSTWGNVKRGPEGLFMTPAKGDAGSAAILDGSGAWRDYIFRTEIDWRSGSNVYLWARFRDDGNFVACNFSSDLVHVEQEYAGETRVIRGALRPNKIPNGEVELGIRVTGRRAECLYGDEVLVVSDFVEPSLDSGGIGIKIWDEVPDTSSIIVRKVSVE